MLLNQNPKPSLLGSSFRIVLLMLQKTEQLIDEPQTGLLLRTLLGEPQKSMLPVPHSPSHSLNYSSQDLPWQNKDFAEENYYGSGALDKLGVFNP